MRFLAPLRSLFSLALVASLPTACTSDDTGTGDTTASTTASTSTTETGSTGSTGSTGDMMPFGGEEDVAMANDLWTEIDGHIANWDAYPGKEGLVAGQSPHGAWQQLRLNDVGAKDPPNPVNGYILVKDNYLEMDEASLDSITVMKKIDGYNPDAADWFWAKYNPDGTLQENPEGIALAGAVGACIGCHAGGGGGDYLFVND